MGFDRRGCTITIPNPAATQVTTLNLRSDFVRPLAFNILSTGTDATMKLKLTDGDSRVFYLDAADKDYDTARIFTPFLTDDVTTGTGPKATDSTGVLAAVAQSSPNPVVKNPIAVEISNGGTAGDVVDFVLEYEYGNFKKIPFVLPVAASSAATLTVSLGCKFAQFVGFKALSVGTSVTQILKFTDADGKVIFLDAAARDYDTAEVDVIPIIDATVTGLTQVVPRNATGAAIQAGVGRIDPPLVRSPLTIALSASEGNDEIVTGSIYVKTG